MDKETHEASSLVPGTTVYQTATRLGKKVYFLAGSFDDAHKKARLLAGKRYRYVCIIGRTNPHFHEAMQVLGFS